jgi:predicted amidohydrolase
MRTPKNRPPLRVTALQLPARWGDAPAQLARVDELLAKGPETDVVLLPEASLAGYALPATIFLPSAHRPSLAPPIERTLAFLSQHPQLSQPPGPEALLLGPSPASLALAAPPVEFAQSLDGPTARALAELAVRHHVHLIGPLVERSGEDCFNAMVGFTPAGERFLHYRKRHPWYPETWAAPGEAPLPLVEVNGHVLTVAICFDVHFVADDSAAALEAADVLLFPSAWVDTEDTRPGLLDALAKRFHLAVVNANWAQGEVTVFGQGRSLVLGADGAVLARAGEGLERIDAVLP